MNKIKKYADFSCKSRKLAIQIKDNHKLENHLNQKNVIIFPKFCTEKVMDGLPNAE